MNQGRPQVPRAHKLLRLRAMRAALMVVLCASSLSAFAAIYKWVDADGRVHYGDTLPQDSAGTRIRVDRVIPQAAPVERAPNTPASVPDARNEMTREIDARRARPAAERAENDERVARERRCLEARQQLAVLEALHLPVYRVHDGTFRALWRSDTYQGERVYLEAGERAEQTARTRGKIAQWCRDPDEEAAQARARARWIASEHCAVARAALQAEQQPAARRSRSEIESAQARVNEQCAVAENGAGVVDSLPGPGLPLGRRPRPD